MTPGPAGSGPAGSGSAGSGPVGSGPAGYRPALDGLRAVAVVLVVLFHSGLGWIPHGYLGVDVFFVLSGYLVTSVILAEQQATGTLSLRRFYARRVRRLLPASLLVIVATAAVTPFVVPRLERVAFVGDARASLLYVANWRFVAAATDYFAHDVVRSPFLHFWSLAVEEQFYAVYPAALLLAMRIARRWRPHRVRSAVGAVLVVVGALSTWRLVTLSATNPVAAYYASDARLHQLVAGAALALGVRRWSRFAASRPRVAASAGVGAVLTLVVMTLPIVSLGVSTRGVLVVAVVQALLFGVEGSPTSGAARFLASRPLVGIGRLSYAVYLWHWPVIVLLGEVLGPDPWSMAAIALAVSLGLAWCSGRLLEQPIRRSDRLDRRPLAVVAGGLCLGLIVAVVVPPVLATHRRPAAWARDARTLVAVPESGEVDPGRVRTVLAEPVPSDEALDLAAETMPDHDEFSCRPSDPATCLVVEEGDLTVLLLGDSNALMLVPALRSIAERDGFRLASMTRPGCPWQDGLTWQTDNLPLVEQCTTARREAYDTLIPALAPDIVLLVEVPRDPGSRADTFWAQSPEEVAAATSASLDRIAGSGARAVMVESLPYSLDEPTLCLSGAASAGECAFVTPLDPFPTEVAMRSEADRRDDVWSVDLDLVGCPLRPVCAAVIDGRVVFRDRYHLSASWLGEHTDELWARLVGSGAFRGWFDPV